MDAASLDSKMEKLSVTDRPDSRRSRRKLSLAATPDTDETKIDGARQGRGMSITDDIKETTDDRSENCPFVSVASTSNVGYVPFNRSKVNQDRALSIPHFNKDSTQALFVVFDGHGLHGDTVAQYLTDQIEGVLQGCSRGQFHSEPEKYFVQGFQELAENLKKDKRVNSQFSGSTCIACFLHGRTLYTANVGDSRAVLGRRKKNGAFEAYALSADQKPDLPDEKSRILKARGRVQPCQGPLGNSLGPARVWLARQDIPGLAMSRSFGDEVAQMVGVISVPVVKKTHLKDRDKILVLGSDGIFEFMSNQEVIDIAAKYTNAEEASEALAAKAKQRWQSEEDVIDDITATVVYLK